MHHQRLVSLWPATPYCWLLGDNCWGYHQFHLSKPQNMFLKNDQSGVVPLCVSYLSLGKAREVVTKDNAWIPLFSYFCCLLPWQPLSPWYFSFLSGSLWGTQYSLYIISTVAIACHQDWNEITPNYISGSVLLFYYSLAPFSDDLPNGLRKW